MPIEIRELVITASFGEEVKNAVPRSQVGQGSTLSQEQVVKACVEKVLEILKEKSER